ncbi:MAG: heavy metal translocating P-type ATPase [Lachnospiraceae bacterium]|nr:heavy metal translocating P-type ATPase [Lachnospiraceae bacterium]
MDRYEVTGMSCAACQARVEKTVAKLDGVDSVAVNLLTNTMQVEGSAGEKEIVEAVTKAGYGAKKIGGTKSVSRNNNTGIVSKTGGTANSSETESESVFADKETLKMIKRLVCSVIFLIPLMYISMGHMMLGWPLPSLFEENPVGVVIVEMLLAIIVMVINQKFFVSGTLSLLHGGPNMDTLVAMGSGVSFIYSFVVLMLMTKAQSVQNDTQVMEYMHDLYFESAAMIVTLITVGKTLETYSKGKTTSELKSLMKLKPKTAVKLIEDETGNEIEVQVPIDELTVGDLFAVKPGTSIPVDGIVVFGESAVDESAITGESIPVDKIPGNKVTGATTNTQGYLKCEATRVGDDTTLAQIIQLVSDASSGKAPIAAIADRVSSVFVPTVVAIAALTFLVWIIAGKDMAFAIARGISVLVISCPCALGLATPVAIMVGSGVGAKHGILFKNAIALENAGKVKSLALDKTGTITEGKPVVTDVITKSSEETFQARKEKLKTIADAAKNEYDDKSKLLQIAYSLERKSEHPIAKAIVDYCERNMVEYRECTNFASSTGNGIAGVIDKQYYCGNINFISSKINAISSNGDDTDVSEIIAGLSREEIDLAREGKTTVFVSDSEKILGVIAVADTLKKDSKNAINDLKSMGINVIMLTGDNEQTAQAIGAEAGVTNVVAELLPDGKEKIIKNETDRGVVTAMVGDGINDAPALTRADIGIAIGAGTDVAIEAADIVLMKSQLKDVPAAIRLSRKVINNIHQNLFWAFFYNIIGIPIAAGALYPIWGIKLNPMFGALAMSLSSVCVVTNALRLNAVDIYRTKSKWTETGKANNYNDSGKENKENKDNKDNKENKENKDKNKENKDNNKENKDMKKENLKMKKTMKITGMMCGHCEAAVKKALEELPQVKEAVVSHEEGTAVVELSESIADEELKKVVEAKDYTVNSIE